MYCPFCRYEITNTTRFCPGCGRNVADERQPEDDDTFVEQRTSTLVAPPVPTTVSASMPVAPSAQEDHEDARINSPAMTTATDHKTQLMRANEEGLGMKWYKFLVFFGLAFGVLVCVANAWTSFTGLILTDDESLLALVYSMYPALRSLMQFRGIAFLVLAVLDVVTWIFMWRFSKNACKLFYASGFGLLAAALIPQLATRVILGLETDSAYEAGVLFGYVFAYVLMAVVFFLPHRKYFRKRQHLFVNP